MKIRAILAASILLLSGQVNADIIDNGDWTTDTNSGLDWLDVNLTLGLNYFEAISTDYVQSDGYRHATESEVINLFAEFGVTDFSGTRTIENWPGGRDIVDVLGSTYDTGNVDGLQGWLDYDVYDTNLMLFIVVDATYPDSGFDNSLAGISDSYPKDRRNPSSGHFLVRETISPVPAPECDIQLSQATYIDGDTITADVYRYANLTSSPITLEAKVWWGSPAGEPPRSFTNLGSDGSVALPPGTDVDVGPLPLQPVTSAMARGSYEFSCRMLDPVTGELLTEDRNFFEIQ